MNDIVPASNSAPQAVQENAAAVPVPAQAAPAQSSFAETWRQEFAGDNKEDLKTLERMADPKSIWDAYKRLRSKVSAGELKSQSPFPEMGTPEEQAAWRQEHNVPATPDEYPEALLANGVVLGEAEAPLVKSFTLFAYQRNWTVDERDAAVAWYYAEQDRAIAAREEADAAFHDESVGLLHQALGRDFNRNMKAYANFADQHLGAELRAEIEAARLPNGRLVGDDPRYVKAFAKIGMEMFPTGTLLPAGGSAPQALESRLAEIKQLMGDQASDYWKGAKAHALQQEYRDLVQTLERQRAQR